jgi:hypothetical protein
MLTLLNRTSSVRIGSFLQPLKETLGVQHADVMAAIGDDMHVNADLLLGPDSLEQCASAHRAMIVTRIILVKHARDSTAPLIK